MTILRYPIEGEDDPWRWDDEQPDYQADDGRYEAWQDAAEARDSFLRACLKRRPQHHEGARRKKMFAVARKTLIAVARLRGRSALVYPWANRRGIAAGLRVTLSSEEEMEWSPRTGYRLVKLDEIPF